MSHTPGPWAFGSFGNLLVVPVVDGVPNKYDPICDLGPQHFPSNTEAYENAALIAAAPELLVALQELSSFFVGKYEEDNRSDDAIDADKLRAEAIASAAIAKATGSAT